MADSKNPEMVKEEREQIVELGSDITRSSKGNIYTLTIIGQVEGHQVAPETVFQAEMDVLMGQLEANKKWISQAFSADDVRKNQEKGKMSAIFTSLNEILIKIQILIYRLVTK